MLSTLVAAAADPGFTDIPAGVAALGGALIGGLAGAIGQYLAEKARQRGERDHQNRLMLQETYVEVISAVRGAREGGTRLLVLSLDRMARDDEEMSLSILEQSNELLDHVTKLQELRAPLQVVGSAHVHKGLGQVVNWALRIADVQKETPTSGKAIARDASAAIRGWADWTIAAIRADLAVDDSRSRHRRKPSVPEPPILIPPKPALLAEHDI